MQKSQIIFAFLVIYLVWGSTFLGIRMAVETIPPLFMAAMRFLLSGSILFAYASSRGARASIQDWKNSLGLGALFFLGNHGLVSCVAHKIPSSLACIIIATEVPIIALLSSLLLPARPLSKRIMLGCALGFLGVVLLFTGSGKGAASGVSIFAILAVLAASFSWSLGAVISQKLKLPQDLSLRAGLQMLSGGVMLLLLSGLSSEIHGLSLANISTRSLYAFAYLVSFGSVLAFVCYIWLLKQMRAEVVATHVFVNPIVAVMLGAWIGGESLQKSQLLSGMFILASVLVFLWPKKRANYR